MPRTRALILILVLLWPALSHAQVTTGTPPFGSFTGGPDIINLASLNSHLAIPVLHKPGRAGFNFTYDLSYDSSVWYPVTAGSTKSWQPIYNWGWRGQTEANVGYVSYSEFSATCYYFDHGVKLPGSFHTWVNNYVYHDPWGVPHGFSGTSHSWSGTGTGGCTLGTNNSVTATATDGSGYTLNADITSGTVTARNGTIYSPPFGSGNASGNFTDRNGNQVSVNSSGVFTDTLGTTALTVAGTSP